MSEFTTDEIIERKVKEEVKIHIDALRAELTMDKKPALVIPCTIKAFKEHFSNNGRPLPHCTFTGWRRKGWVTTNGRIVVETKMK